MFRVPLPLTGEGGSGKNNNDGVRLDNTDLSTVNSSITIDGTGASLGSNTAAVSTCSADRPLPPEAQATSASPASAPAAMPACICPKGSLSAVDGNITVGRYQQRQQDFQQSGVRIQSAPVTSRGSGDLLIEGTRGQRSHPAPNNRGVYLVKNITTATDGSLTINGTGGSGTSLNNGVHISGGSTQWTNAAINIMGDALATTSAANNIGVYLQGGVNLRLASEGSEFLDTTRYHSAEIS